LGTDLVLGLGCRGNVHHWLLSILAGSWHVELETLAVEHLVVVKSRGGVIETNVLSGEHFVISCTTLVGPLGSRIFKVILHFLVRFQHIFVSFHQRILNFIIILDAVGLFGVQDPHIWVRFLQKVEAIGGRHEDAVCFRSLFLSSGECTSGVCRFTFDCQVVLSFGLLVNFNKTSCVLARCRSLLDIKPRLLESVSVATEWSQADALLLLLATVVLVPGGGLQLQRAMDWIVDVDVSAWARIWCLHPLVNWALLSTVERCMDRFLLDDPIFDVIFLFLVVVLPGTWILGKSLSSIWRLSLILPELSSFSFGQEGLWLLSNELAIRCRSQMIIRCLLYRYDSFVGARAWSQRLSLSILAVGHLTLEDSVLPRRIELFFTLFVKIVDTWPRIVRPCHIIVLKIVLFENSSLNFRLMELVLRVLLSNGRLLRIVGRWTNCVESSCSVGRSC
jgi:hypothetical protein